MKGWLEKYQTGGRKRSTNEIPTKNYVPPFAPLDPEFVFQMQNRPAEEHIQSSPERKGVISKAATIARNPMTALQYKMQGQPIPDYLEHGNRNSYDNAVDVINPMTYLDAAGRTLSGKHFREEGFTPDALVKTGLDALMLTGLGNEIIPNKVSTVRIPGNPEYAGIPGNEGRIAFVDDNGELKQFYSQKGNDPAGVTNSPEMQQAIKAKLKAKQDVATHNANNPNDQQYMNHYISYDLKSVSRPTTNPLTYLPATVGVLGNGSNRSEYQYPNIPEPVSTINYRNNTPDDYSKQQVTKQIQKKKVPTPIIDTPTTLQQDSQKRVEWLHSHNGEEPILDSARVVDSNKKAYSGYSTQGYKSNSPDKGKPMNVIPSRSITMKGVDMPIYGKDASGYGQMMYPGHDYMFPSAPVTEIPIRQQGGVTQWGEVTNQQTANSMANKSNPNYRDLGNGSFYVDKFSGAWQYPQSTAGWGNEAPIVTPGRQPIGTPEQSGYQPTPTGNTQQQGDNWHTDEATDYSIDSVRQQRDDGWLQKFQQGGMKFDTPTYPGSYQVGGKANWLDKFK